MGSARNDKAHIGIMLRQLPLFECLNKEELYELEAAGSIIALERNQLIYGQHETPLHIYYLIRGYVKTGATSEDGREIIKLFLRPGALFGEFCLFEEHAAHEYAVNLSAEAEVLAISKKTFKSVMEKNPVFNMNFIRWIGQRLRAMENRLEGMILKDARERIIDFLIESAHMHGERVGYETLIRHSLTQQDIANFTGTSRQTVTSVLNELRKSNLIYFNRKSILIRDLEKLS